LVGTATADDLAVVRIAPFAHMTVTQIGDSSKLVVGQEEELCCLSDGAA
jgi:putative serine protease PepD